MATRVFVFGGFDNGPGSMTRAEYEWDDVSLLVTLIRVIDDASQSCRAWIMRTSDNLLVERVVQPGQTLVTTLPTNGPNRVFVTLDARGRPSITGWIGGCEYPSSV